MLLAEIIYAKIRKKYSSVCMWRTVYRPFNQSVCLQKRTVNLGLKLKTEQLQIVEMFWQVFSGR